MSWSRGVILVQYETGVPGPSASFTLHDLVLLMKLHTVKAHLHGRLDCSPMRRPCQCCLIRALQILREK
jgi:hypothetical protein